MSEMSCDEYPCSDETNKKLESKRRAVGVTTANIKIPDFPRIYL